MQRRRIFHRPRPVTPTNPVRYASILCQLPKKRAKTTFPSLSKLFVVSTNSFRILRLMSAIYTGEKMNTEGAIKAVYGQIERFRALHRLIADCSIPAAGYPQEVERDLVAD